MTCVLCAINDRFKFGLTNVDIFPTELELKLEHRTPKHYS